MTNIFKEILQLLDDKEELVFVTVIGSSGSTPRGAGAHMIVRKDGTASGTVGGGAIEYQSQLLGKTALAEKRSFLKTYTLTRNQVEDLGMICGGEVVLYFQYISPSDQAFKTVCLQALAAFHRDENCWLLTDITDETAWRAGIYSKSLGLVGNITDEFNVKMPAKAAQIKVKNRRYYIEPLVCSGKVYLFGGGHVAQELVPVISHVGFRCVVFDDREKFANQGLFPLADQTIVGDFENISDYITITEHDYICVLTRGHQFDYLVQKQALHTPAHYIGVIGSRKKLSVHSARLKEEGYSDDELKRIQAPIGLPILAETPAEIAVSIAAELIQARAKLRNME